MNRKQELLRTAALAGVLVVALLLISRCQGSNWSKERTALLSWNDSVRAEIRFQETRAIEAEGRANLAAIERDAARDSMVEAITEADRVRARRLLIKPVASTVGAAPSNADTLRAVTEALELCDDETSALRVAIGQADTALQRAATTETELRGALTLQKASVADLTTANRKLSSMLASAAPRCRFLLFPCPSRTQVAAGTAITTAVLTIALTR